MVCKTFLCPCGWGGVHKHPKTWRFKRRGMLGRKELSTTEPRGEILAEREQNTSPGGGKDYGHRSTGTYRSNACPRLRVHPVLPVSALTFLLHVEVPFHGVGADGLVLEGVFLHLLHQQFHFRPGSFEAVSCLERRNFVQRIKCRNKKKK